jgi:4-alpha-glucanotransferase
MRDVSYLAHSPAARQWQNIAIKPHHGIAIPLFSLHSANSYGIGEFTDLALLIDWCVSIGFDIIQLLPLNDTGHGISPYSALSAFALNPVFLGLASLPHVNEHLFLKEELKALPKFSSVSRIDYPRVYEYKERFLRHYYRFEGPQLLKSEAYQHFVIQAASWLKGYAVFKILKKRYQGSSWETWPETERSPNSEWIDSIACHEQEEFNWYCFLQFLCDEQLKAAKIHASHKQVFLMGDIPILIDRDSADVWLHQDLFNLQYSAGAPPDIFTEDGQNWGFPIYNWSMMAHQNYQWWIDRLQWTSHYYHIYRVDHIVGFFRIWSIPLGLHGKNGHFIPQDQTTWIDQGQRIMLMMLDACNMLPIGEDLGVVPPEVRNCLSALGICGTRVMRWERKWEEDGQFISPDQYPMVSMTTVSTHDSEPLQLWWKANPIEAQFFAQFKGWSYQPLLSRDHHREILWDSHHTTSLFHINLLQEYLALIPGLSWPNPEDERINVPGIFSEHNWCYRLRPSLEELINQNSLKHLMQELIK